MPTSGDKPNFEKTPTKQFIFRQSQAKKDQFFSRLNEVTGWIKAPKFSSKGFWFGFLSSDVKLICWANDSFFNVLFGDLSDEGILDLRLFWWLEKLKHITKWWFNADEFHGRICKIITWKQTQGIGIRITTKKVDLSNHKHTKIRNGGILYVFLATIHCIHSYSKYVTSCKYLGLPNPANSGTLGTPAKTTMEPDNGHIGRRDFPLGSIISWVSSKLSGSTLGAFCDRLDFFRVLQPWVWASGTTQDGDLEQKFLKGWVSGWFHPGFPNIMFNQRLLRGGITLPANEHRVGRPESQLHWLSGATSCC